MLNDTDDKTTKTNMDNDVQA